MKYREPEIVVPELEQVIGTRTTSKWTDREERVLRIYWPKKVPVRSLAKYLGKTPDAVERKATRLGLRQ